METDLAARADAGRGRGLAAAVAGALLVALDQAAVATVMPSIADDLGGLDGYATALAAYMVTSTAVLPLAGRIGDARGRRRPFLAGIAVLAAGAIAAALAPSMAAFAAGRAVAGTGAGLVLTSAFAVAAEVYPPADRARAAAIASVAVALASVAGPVLGGAISDALGWRALFAGEALFAIVALPATAKGLPGGRPAPGPARTRALLARRACATALGATLLLGMAIQAASAYLPLFLRSALRISGARTGAALIPMVGAIVAGSVAAGRLARRVSEGRLAVAGLVLGTAGAALASRLSPASTLGEVALGTGIFGLGVGMAATALLVVAQNHAPAGSLGAATGLAHFARSAGGAAGIAAAGLLLGRRLATDLGPDRDRLLTQATNAARAALASGVGEGLALASAAALAALLLALPGLFSAPRTADPVDSR